MRGRRRVVLAHQRVGRILREPRQVLLALGDVNLEHGELPSPVLFGTESVCAVAHGIGNPTDDLLRIEGRLCAEYRRAGQAGGLPRNGIDA